MTACMPLRNVMLISQVLESIIFLNTKLLTCNSNISRSGLFLVDDSICIIRYATDIISIIHALNLIKCYNSLI